MHIIVALGPEARPIVEHFGLEPDGREGPFVFHRRDHLQLVVSGVGTHAAAAAVGALGARDPHAAWLNVGLGGHRELPLGSARLAHKIIDPAGETCGYPSRTFDAPCPSGDVRTVARPEREFSTEAVYDMEASGFFAVASRYAPVELVHVFKIVSDNAANPAERPSKATVHRLMTDQLGAIEHVVNALEGLAAEVGPRPEPRELESFLARWRFSVTQRARLRELLRRWEVIAPGEPAAGQVSGLETSRAVLEALAVAVTRAPLARHPVTRPPAARPPATSPPATSPPATRPPATSSPATQANPARPSSAPGRS